MKKYIVGLFLLGFVLTSCRKDDIPAPPDGTEKDRTFFIYMAADNSLGAAGKTNGEFDYKNIALLLRGVRSYHLLSNNIIIYQDPKIANPNQNADYPEWENWPKWSDARPRLLEIYTDENGTVAFRTIKQYEEQNSGTGATLSAVLKEVMDLYQTPKYGFLMWSHGTGWLPGNPNYNTRAIGQDGSNWIDIEDFADALPDDTFDYLLFDACYMAGAEVAYALRNKADYILAAPTEIMGTGMPYHLMPEYLLGTSPKLETFCDAFYNYYGGASGNSSISLIDTKYLGELAAVVKDILLDVSAEEVYAIANEDMQWFDRLASGAHPYHVFFDLGDYMEEVATPAQYAAFTAAMKKAVPHYRHSDSFLVNQSPPGFDINSYCGLSAYVPRNTARLQNVNDYYKTTDWYRAVYPASFGF